MNWNLFHKTGIEQVLMLFQIVTLGMKDGNWIQVELVINFGQQLPVCIMNRQNYRTNKKYFILLFN